MTALVEVDAGDVIKLILQFCKENNLTESYTAIQKECRTSLNTVDNIEAFAADISSGRWNVVLPQVAQLKIPKKKIQNVYEQVILEMIELREFDTARVLLRQTVAIALMKEEQPERYMRLESLMSRTHCNLYDIYLETPKDKRRAAIAQTLLTEVSVVPPSRLLALISQALKWQRHVGKLPHTHNLDLFRDTVPTLKGEEDTCPNVEHLKIKFSKKSHPECCQFSPDGQMLATGSIDGFIEIWDYNTGRLKRDLQYQANDKFMMHDTAVLALSFSRDSNMLVSGSQDGKVKVWRVQTGTCVRSYEQAHRGGITSLNFSPDSSYVLSTSFDGILCIHGCAWKLAT